MSRIGLLVEIKGYQWLTVRSAGPDQKPQTLRSQNCQQIAIVAKKRTDFGSQFLINRVFVSLCNFNPFLATEINEDAICKRHVGLNYLCPSLSLHRVFCSLLK